MLRIESDYKSQNVELSLSSDSHVKIIIIVSIFGWWDCSKFISFFLQFKISDFFHVLLLSSGKKNNLKEACANLFFISTFLERQSLHLSKVSLIIDTFICWWVKWSQFDYFTVQFPDELITFFSRPQLPTTYMLRSLQDTFSSRTFYCFPPLSR